MEKVGIIGAATTPCMGRNLDLTYWGLAQKAMKMGTEDAGIDVSAIQAGVLGIYNDMFEGQFIPEGPLAGIIGMKNKPLIRVSTGGATGVSAMYTAWALVASGRYDIVACLGVEKATDCFDLQSGNATPEVIKTIAYSWDKLFERPQGATAADSYSLVVLGYLDIYPNDLKEEVRAQIVEILCKQAKENEFAQRQKEEVTAEMVLASPYITYPFKKLETCVYTEGAGIVIFASEEATKAICENNGEDPIWVKGVGHAVEDYFIGRRGKHKDIHRIESDHIAAQEAYAMAGIKDPQREIGVVEVHDAFTPQLEITLAEMGFVPMGRADSLITEGLMAPHGNLLVNPSGGLTFCGHYVGGSNIMSCWSARKTMLEDEIRLGAVHGTGGSIAQIGGVFVLERGELS